MKPTREEALSEPAGRQLDAWIAEYALGWVWRASIETGCRWFAPPEHCDDFGPATGTEPMEYAWWISKNEGYGPWKVPHYSTDFAALKDIISLPLPDFSWHIESENTSDGVKWFAMIWGGVDTPDGLDIIDYPSNHTEDTLEVAVCHAALLYAIGRT
jgi:hypothetical protein